MDEQQEIQRQQEIARSVAFVGTLAPSDKEDIENIIAFVQVHADKQVIMFQTAVQEAARATLLKAQAEAQARIRTLSPVCVKASGHLPGYIVTTDRFMTESGEEEWYVTRTYYQGCNVACQQRCNGCNGQDDCKKILCYVESRLMETGEGKCPCHGCRKTKSRAAGAA